MSKPVCVIVGAGPGNGAAFARRFSQEGYGVALLARNERILAEMEQAIPGTRAYPFDAASGQDAGRVFPRIREEMGPVDVLVYNASSRGFADLDHTSGTDFEGAWRVNALGCLLASKEAVQDMRASGRGNIVVIGATAALSGNAGFVAFAAAKSAQRSLAQSMARQLGPEGIHVSYVVIDAMVDGAAARRMMPDKPGSFFAQPDDIAQSIWFLTRQPRSAWTFELDLRPFAEHW